MSPPPFPFPFPTHTYRACTSSYRASSPTSPPLPSSVPACQASCCCFSGDFSPLVVDRLLFFSPLHLPAPPACLPSDYCTQRPSSSGRELSLMHLLLPFPCPTSSWLSSLLSPSLGSPLCPFLFFFFVPLRPTGRASFPPFLLSSPSSSSPPSRRTN